MSLLEKYSLCWLAGMDNVACIRKVVGDESFMYRTFFRSRDVGASNPVLTLKVAAELRRIGGYK